MLRSTSGDGKRGVCQSAPSYRAHPRLYHPLGEPPGGHRRDHRPPERAVDEANGPQGEGELSPFSVSHARGALHHVPETWVTTSCRAGCRVLHDLLLLLAGVYADSARIDPRDWASIHSP